MNEPAGRWIWWTAGLASLALWLGGIGLAAAQPRPGDAAQGRAPSLDEIMRRCDANGDGKVTLAEVPQALKQRFALWDRDGDGVATRDEIRQARLALGIEDSGRQTAASPRGAVMTSPTLLKGPADWRLETLPVPPGFAPDITLRGAEEARFAPGMFVTSSTTYFTCVLAITAEGTPKLGPAEIKDFLERYYRGLSAGVGRRKGLTVDPAKIQAAVQTLDPETLPAPRRFAATVPFFDTFNDGRRILLNVEARTLARPAAAKSYLILLVSPQPRDGAVWRTLRQIGDRIDPSTP